MRFIRQSEISQLSKQAPEQSYSDWLKSIGGRQACATGRIGNNKTVHRLHLDVITNDDGEDIIVDASCYCGSHRWSMSGRTQLNLAPDTEITCKKCW